jgi:carboxypeptidase C (cathepsin A)
MLWALHCKYCQIETLDFPFESNRQIFSIAPDEAAAVINENKEKITLEFVEGTHMVPNETPDVISKFKYQKCSVVSVLYTNL